MSICDEHVQRQDIRDIHESFRVVDLKISPVLLIEQSASCFRFQ